MEDIENKEPEANTADAAKDAAKDAANALAGEAQKDMNEIKGRGLKGFFSFDHLYFPIIARYLFILVCILTLLGGVFSLLGSFIGIFRVGVVQGLIGVLVSLIGTPLAILGIRIWFEMIVLGFTINANLEKIRDQK